MNKKLILFIAGLIFSAMAFAQGGVDFQHLTFDEALAKAKAEKKLVFVDCYTTWCGPCKYMTNEIFPQKAAGDFFNPRFVSVKFDMEKGEGIELKDKLGVRAFPSFFIIRPDGTVQHAIVGGDELEGFIQRVKTGLNEKTSLHYLNQKYEKGKMSKKELMNYYNALSDAYDQKKADQIHKELLTKVTQKDKLKADFWPLFEDQNCRVGTPDFDLILNNIPTFRKNIGKEKLDDYLHQAYSRALSPYIGGRPAKDQVALQTLKEQIDGLDIAQKQDLLDQYTLAATAEKGNVAEVISMMEANVDSLNENNLYQYFAVLRKLGDKMTKADFARVAALESKMAANPANAKMKEYLPLVFDAFKRKAHVGVYFEELTFEQALTKAKQLNKRIFMDCYTSWCGPCKYMSGTVFPQEKMGDFLNKMICVKYDMEKGEGPELAKKFGVRAYPTFVIINPDGSVRHKLVGGGEPDQFIERVKEADDDTKATGVLEAKYNEGNRDKAFLKQYVGTLASLYSADAGKVAGELFEILTDEEKVSPDYWFLLENKDYLANGYDYILANRERLNQAVGKEKVDRRLGGNYRQKAMMIMSGRDAKTTVKELDQIKKELIALKLSDQKNLIAQLNIAKAVLSGNMNTILTICEKEVPLLPIEEFPLMLAFQAKEKGTPAQLNRWVKLCKKVADSSDNKPYAARMRMIIKQLEKKG